MYGKSGRAWSKSVYLNTLRLDYPYMAANEVVIDLDNSLSPAQCRADTKTNVNILLIRPLGTNFSKNVITLRIFI